MPMTYNEEQPESERRYDPETIRKVTALAARLQRDHQDTLTAGEMESIGLEVGLQPAFIHQAISNLEAQHLAEQATETEQSEQTTAMAASMDHTIRSGEFVAALCALSLPLFWGPMAYMWHSSPGMMTLFTLLTPAPLAALMGFLTGKKKLSTMSAALMMLSLSPTFPFLYFRHLYTEQIDGGMMTGAIFLYNLFGIPAATYFASMGSSLRQTYFPLGSRSQEEAIVSKQEMQGLLSSMQQEQAAVTPIRHAFLSVDVVRPSEMRGSAPAITVDHTFGQYQRWADEVAQGCGGMLQSLGGDSRLFLFPSETSAVRAARRMQEGISGFNTALNRLPLPFQLRCGISAGEASVHAGTSPTPLHSPAIDRAVFLQQRAEPGDIVLSGETAATGLIELGGLAPLPEALFGPNAFSWHAAGQNQAAFSTPPMTA
jgi:class 3 adenylate cyclase